MSNFFPQFMFALIKYLYLALNIVLIVGLFRLLSAARLSWPQKLAPVLLALFAATAFPLSRVIEGNGALVTGLAFIGAFWLPFVLYVLLLYLVVWIGRGLQKLCGKGRAAPRTPRQQLATFAVVALGSALLTGAAWVNSQYPVVRPIQIATPADTLPLRIVALSDTHLGRLVRPRDFERLIDLIEPLQPDLVLFAGDILDDYDGYDPAATRRSLQRLHPKLGIWGVLGNHEYYAGSPVESAELLEAGGIRILRDAWADLDDAFVLIGRDDRTRERLSGTPRTPLATLVSRLPERLRDRPRLLLDHQPIHLEEAEQAGILLQLSGHTHNGQLFPFNFLVAALYENAHGPSQRGQTRYWVSSGAGTWGPRARNTGRPEILQIDLQPARP